MSWQELAEDNPELAAFGTARLVENDVAYLATVRKDGSPRVHPVTPVIGEGRLFLFMEPTSPKGHDLRRDGRFAMHSSVEDSGGGKGEFFLSGRANLVEDAAVRQSAIRLASYDIQPRYILFELSIDRALGTTYDNYGPLRRGWDRQAAG
jgi:general stress protein 26